MPTSSPAVFLFVAAMTASGLLPLLLLPLAALGASAPAPCLAGDEACPVSGQSLLQSNRKLNVDRWQMFLKNQDSDKIVEELQARAETVVQSGQHMTPLERTTLKALNTTLMEMIPAMIQGHKEDQAEIDAGVQSIKNCNKNFDEDAESSKTAKQGVDASRKDHKDCRGEQSKLKADAANASGALDKFWKPLVLPKKPEVASRTLLDNIKKWLQDNEKPLEDKLSKKATADAAVEKKGGVCDSKQKLLESGFCEWFGRATAASKSYARCWSQSGSTFAKLRQEALGSAEGRKVQYVALHKIQCYMEVIFRPSRKSLNKCKQLSPDTSQFNLTNTVAEAEKDVAGELGPVDLKPGDESWKQSVYAGLADVANVTPCSVAHFCNSDEKVLSHRCMACEPGKENQAGDDALGPNTSCTAILCSRNQYVASNACKPCAVGTKNNGSDDASGGDTSCTAILCQAGQRVQNNSCHSCPAGSKNEAGGHDASGADTSCDPIKCGRDHYVQSNACHTCPAGKTRAAGDDATKGNTTCIARCNANHKVVSNRCKGCPPGKTNVADDDASGADTVCDATNCTANQHVVSNACIACPDGTTRPAGDDASSTDTTCSPILCQVNEYVKNKACKQCPSDQTNEAGNDASGTDTSCNVKKLIMVNTRKTWADATAHCEGMDRQLVEIYSEKERQALVALVGAHHVWLGANDRAKEGTFVWASTNAAMSYTKWRSGEPNNAGGGEDCMFQYGTIYPGFWNDASCTYTAKSVCEAKKLIMVNTKKTWADATAHCEGMGRRLVEIYSEKENQALVALIGANHVWMGGNDRAKEGKFVWASTNAAMPYTKWNRGEPNDVHGQDCMQHYGTAHGGSWDDLSCTATRKIVCEAKF